MNCRAADMVNVVVRSVDGLMVTSQVCDQVILGRARLEPPISAASIVRFEFFSRGPRARDLARWPRERLSSCVIVVSSRDLQSSREQRCEDHDFEPLLYHDALSFYLPYGPVFSLIHIWCSSIPPICPCLATCGRVPPVLPLPVFQNAGDDVHHENNAHHDPFRDSTVKYPPRGSNRAFPRWHFALQHGMVRLLSNSKTHSLTHSQSTASGSSFVVERLRSSNALLSSGIPLVINLGEKSEPSKSVFLQSPTLRSFLPQFKFLPCFKKHWPRYNLNLNDLVHG